MDPFHQYQNQTHSITEFHALAMADCFSTERQIERKRNLQLKIEERGVLMVDRSFEGSMMAVSLQNNAIRLELRGLNLMSAVTVKWQKFSRKPWLAQDLKSKAHCSNYLTLYVFVISKVRDYKEFQLSGSVL
jgi:hypothetical protein